MQDFDDLGEQYPDDDQRFGGGSDDGGEKEVPKTMLEALQENGNPGQVKK